MTHDWDTEFRVAYRNWMRAKKTGQTHTVVEMCWERYVRARDCRDGLVYRPTQLENRTLSIEEQVQGEPHDA